MSKFNVGDRVKPSDINAFSIPAYRDMRGTVVAAREAQGGADKVEYVQIKWDTDSTPDFGYRLADTLSMA